jgi:Phosphoesterase family
MSTSYFDHVSTPTSAPNPDGINVSDFNFDRLGVRVPMLLISPWVEAGSVLSKPNGPQSDSQFEHSSIPATIKKVNSSFVYMSSDGMPNVYIYRFSTFPIS